MEPPVQLTPLHRYRHVTISDHLTTSSASVDGYAREGQLGLLNAAQDPGTAPLYACLVGTDTFSSRSGSCEGQRLLGLIGYLYVSPPAQAHLVLWRCRTADTGEHFDSTANCEGQPAEGILGYLRTG